MPAIGKQQHHYVAVRQRLEDQVAVLQQQVAIADASRQALAGRVQVLNNIAEQQTFLAAELQRLTAFKTAGMQQLDSSAACAVTAAAGASHAVQSYHHHQLDQQPHRLPGNYCCRLMAAATEEQWQQVAHMTPHDWCCFGAATAAKLSLLMELIRREDRAAAAAAADPAAADPAGASSGSVCTQAQQHGVLAGQLARVSCTLSSPTEAPDAAGQPSSRTPAGAAAASDAEQQLNSVIDSFVTTVLLSISSTRGAAYRAASFINLATGEQLGDAVPASHWRQVAAAMAVSQQQRQQLSIMLQQSTRYRQRAWAQQSHLCAALADDTARKLQELHITPEGATQEQQGSAQTAAGDAAASASADAAVAALAAAFGGTNPAPAPAAVPARAAAAAAAVSTATEATLHKMQGTLWGLTTSIQVLLAGALDVLSRLQVARMLVAAYPHLPHITAVVEAICIEGETAAMQQLTDVPADSSQQQQQQQVKAEPAAPQQQQKPRWRERHLAKKQQQQQQIKIKKEEGEEPPPPLSQQQQQQQQQLQQSVVCPDAQQQQQQQEGRQRVSQSVAVHNAALARRQLQLALQRDAFMARLGDLVD